MEGYINHNDPWAPMQDRFAQGMIRTVIDCMDRLLENPEDPQARATLMWTATFAWNGFYTVEGDISEKTAQAGSDHLCRSQNAGKRARCDG